MKNSALKWIEAGKALITDKNLKIRCPECDNEFLVVKDIFDETDRSHFERVLYCEKCCAKNAIRMKK